MSLYSYASSPCVFYRGPLDAVGLPHGVGTLLLGQSKATPLYTGDFCRGEMTGRGRYVLQRGDVYVGEVAQGVQHGQGVLVRADNSRLEAVFVNGVPHGEPCREVDAEGGVYHGAFYRGKRHGPALYYPAGEGVPQRQVWKNGVLLEATDAAPGALQ